MARTDQAAVDTGQFVRDQIMTSLASWTVTVAAPVLQSTVHIIGLLHKTN